MSNTRNVPAQSPRGGMAPCIAGSVPTSNDFVFFDVLYCFIRVNQDSIKDLRDQNIELLGRIHCLEQRLKP